MSDLKPVQAYLRKDQHKWLDNKKKKAGRSKTIIMSDLIDAQMLKEKAEK